MRGVASGKRARGSVGTGIWCSVAVVYGAADGHGGAADGDGGRGSGGGSGRSGTRESKVFLILAGEEPVEPAQADVARGHAVAVL